MIKNVFNFKLCFFLFISILQSSVLKAGEPIKPRQLPNKCHIQYFSSSGFSLNKQNLASTPAYDDEPIRASSAAIRNCPPISIKFCSAKDCVQTTTNETFIEFDKRIANYNFLTKIVSYWDNPTEASVGEGVYRDTAGTIFYSNGSHYCKYPSYELYLVPFGAPVYTQLNSGIPPFLVNDGDCKLPEGHYRLPSGLILFAASSGHYCSFANMDSYTSQGSPAFTEISGLPGSMMDDGFCQ